MQDAADKIGTSKSQVDRILSNKSSLSLEMYAKTCIGLNLDFHTTYTVI